MVKVSGGSALNSESSIHYNIQGISFHRELDSACPYHVKCHKSDGFHKVIDLEDQGLTIFSRVHPTYGVDIARQSQDMVIVQNPDKLKLTSVEVQHILNENKITCPRCRQLLKHTQELMSKMSDNTCREIIGVCGRCHVKALSQGLCEKCTNVAIKFSSLYGSQKKHRSSNKKMVSYSDIDFNLFKPETPIPDNLKIKEMFESQENSSYVELLKISKEKHPHLLYKDNTHKRKETIEIYRTKTTYDTETTLSENEKNFGSRTKLDQIYEDNNNETLTTALNLNTEGKHVQEQMKKYGYTRSEIEHALKPRKKPAFSDSEVNKDTSNFFPDTQPAIIQPKIYIRSEAKEKLEPVEEKEQLPKMELNSKDMDTYNSKQKHFKDKESSKQEQYITKNKDASKIKQDTVKDIDLNKKIQDIIKDIDVNKKKQDTLKETGGYKKKRDTVTDIDANKKKQNTVKYIDANKKKADHDKDASKTQLGTTEVLVFNMLKAVGPASSRSTGNVSKKSTTLNKYKKSQNEDSDVLSISDCLNNNTNKLEPESIIIGENYIKYRARQLEHSRENNSMGQNEQPVLFQKEFIFDNIQGGGESNPVRDSELAKKDQSEKALDCGKYKATIQFALSNRAFIENGWTMLPTEKIVRKMNVYKMHPAQPQFDWFARNKNKEVMTYSTGEKLAEFDTNGRGRWYYRNGRLALDYYDAEETNAQQRFVVYSSGEPDDRGRTYPITILATFDYLGNGVVFDNTGKIRLKYNQTEGVVLDRKIGPVTHWKWHTLNDPPVLQKVMIDTQMSHKDQTILNIQEEDNVKKKVVQEVPTDNTDMIAIELDNLIKEKRKKLASESSAFTPFQIKMKALKINEHFSLKILDQATVYLVFRDGTTNIRLNLGMILDHQEIIGTDTSDVGAVSNSLERFPAATESIEAMQRSIEFAQRFERTRTERDRKIRPSVQCASIDKLVAATSKPYRPTLSTLPVAGSQDAPNYNYCRCRKQPSYCNVYYNSRLM